MNITDNIEWLKSFKKQIGQAQHRDLWHFEEVLDETISRLVPLANPHGRLIDADALPLKAIDNANYPSNYIKVAPTIISAEDGMVVSSTIESGVKMSLDEAIQLSDYDVDTYTQLINARKNLQQEE